MRSFQCCLLSLLVLQSFVSPQFRVAASPSPNSLILRVRLADGSMEKIQVDKDKDLSLSQILSKYPRESGDTILVGPKKIDDDSLCISKLGVKHGSMITIQAKPKKTKTKPSFALDHDANQFQPFPDLHKNYHAAVRARARNRSGGSSFGDLSNLHASLHVVEPQPTAPLLRVYMCHVSAARFHANTKAQRVGLLLGTVQRERVDTKPKKMRTSLSSTPSDADFCQVAKVHAIYEPPQPKGNDKIYDAGALMNRDDASLQRILKLAGYLGLKPVGWIFTYPENRHGNDNEGLPVWCADIQTGAQLQIAEMKARDRTEGAKFATLAMDAATGATEAFALSDVVVQMVAEDMLMLEDENDRHAKTQNAVVVDGRETKSLDSVLCLVNTALLSHDGLYASSTKPTKKNGSLTTKTKKALVAALGEKTDGKLLTLLGEFRILVALDTLLHQNDDEMQDLCRAVRKWARGQKQGTTVPANLKRKLTTLLSSH